MKGMGRATLLVLTAAALYGQDALKERALGEQLTKELTARTTAVETPDVVNYVNRIGRLLAPQFRPGIQWTFAVIVDDNNGKMHEPIAYPGGYIFVSTALLREAQSEGELAGMMAHAMAHVALRQGRMHGTAPVIFLGGSGNESAIVPTGMLAQMRQGELEADQAAAKALVNARYDALEFVNYIRRTQPETANALPPRDQRIAALERTVRELVQR